MDSHLYCNVFPLFVCNYELNNLYIFSTIYILALNQENLIMFSLTKMLFIYFYSKIMNKQKEMLKKPSHFHDPGSTKQSDGSALLSPAMLLSKSKEKATQPIESKKLQIQEVKKPSDFVLNTDVRPKKQSENDMHLNDQRLKLNGSYPNQTFDKKITLVAGVKTLVHPSISDELFKLKDIVKCQKQEILLSKRQLDVEKLNWHDTEKNLKTELEKAEMKISNMQKKLDETETSKFMETKSIYENFISFQAKYDREKYILEEKVSAFEEKAFKFSNEKEELLRILQSERDENIGLQKSIKEIETEMKVIAAKYEVRLTQVNITMEELKHENVHCKIIESELKEKCHKLETVVAEKLTSIQEMEAANKTLQSLSKAQSETVLYQEAKINELEEKLADSLKEKDNFEMKAGEKDKENEQLKGMLNRLNTELELIKAELSNVKFEYENLKLSKSEYKEYEKTCKTLQLTNRQLNIRLETLNEMLQMQEGALNGLPFDSQSQKLLQTWRCKVYQLLVLLKSKDI